MRDESHLDDMRSAIRGDFERLAERRGGQELMRPEPEPEPEPAPEPEPELAPEPEVEVAPEPELKVEVVRSEPPAEPAHELPEPPPVEPPRKGFLDRLLGR